MRFTAHLFACLLPLLVGCVIPEFSHPLSDADSNLIDERLIGHWEQFKIAENGKEELAEDDKIFNQFVIFGKHSERSTEMIAARTVLEKDGTVSHESRIGRATKLGEEFYFSWELKEDEYKQDADVPAAPTVFYITRYLLSEKGKKLTMYMLDTDKIIEALREGRLAGIVEEEVRIKNGEEKTEVTRVAVESTTADLRDFFQKFGSTTFDTEEPVYYRKRHPRK